jgi:membrane protein
MNKNKLNFPRLLLETYKETVKDQFQNTSAALAFYLFLSLAPMVGFSIFISNKILGAEKTTGTVIPILKNFFSVQFVNLITFFLSRDKHVETDGLLTLSILSGLALAYATKEYFAMLYDAVELTWNKRGDKTGLVAFFIRLKEDLTVAFAALFIIILFITFRSILPFNPSSISTSNLFYKIIHHIVAFVYEYALFFALYYFCFFLLPPVKVYWKNAFLPAIIGALLQGIGREIMKVYSLNNSTSDLAESFLIVLFWFYYSSMVFFFAAEFAKVYISMKQKIDYKSLKFDS